MHNWTACPSLFSVRHVWYSYVYSEHACSYEYDMQVRVHRYNTYNTYYRYVVCGTTTTVHIASFS